MNYYTSDLHFGYEKVIQTAHRPFSSCKEMNDTLVRNINERTDRNDVLIILGDVAWYGYNPVKELKAIHCHKVLIAGNHDASLIHHEASFRRCFADIRDTELIREKDCKIFLSHYPICEWDGYCKGIYHFYGHVHNNIYGGGYLMRLYPTAVNVGVDCNDFKPKTAKELIDERLDHYYRDLDLLPQLPDDFLASAVFRRDMDNRGTRKVDFEELLSGRTSEISYNPPFFSPDYK